MIRLKYRKQVWELEGNFTVRQAIKKVGLNAESVSVSYTHLTLPTKRIV